MPSANAVAGREALTTLEAAKPPEQNVNVPILDLGRTHRRIASELAQRWQQILAQSSFILGPEVRQFEAAFAAFLGVEGCVALGNGTDALLLALRALELAPGDEVIVPAFSFFATAEAVAYLGGKVVFADVDPETLNLDPADVAARVTPRTVGVIGVHLYGRPFDADGMLEVCGRHGLWLVEDAAQAQGALYKGRRVGGFGQLAAWSFYPTKNLGCFGDGGAATGNDRALLDRVRTLGNQGQAGRYHHVAVGTNSRLDSLQAAVLNCRLPLLDADNARRREIACRYHGAFTGLGDVRLPPDREGVVSVYHQYTLRTARRDALMQHLKEAGVASAVHYPSPLHLQPALAGRVEVRAGDLPVSTAAAAEVLCLPIFPELTNDEADAVCAAVRGFFAEG
jgi:dTDP-4-amino-4,6-dideoxygalactose transaminase